MIIHTKIGFTGFSHKEPKNISKSTKFTFFMFNCKTRFISFITHPVHSLWNMLQIIALPVLNSFYFLRTFYSTCLHIFVHLMCTVTLSPRSVNCNLILISFHHIVGQSYFIIFPTHLTILFQNFFFVTTQRYIFFIIS